LPFASPIGFAMVRVAAGSLKFDQPVSYGGSVEAVDSGGCLC
jgi:hypothetical protein